MRTITYWLALLLIFVMPWENTVTLSGLGTVSRAVGVLLAMAWIASVVLEGSIRNPRAMHIVVYLFFLFNAASFFWTVDSEETLDRMRTYAQLLALIVVLWDMLRTREAFLGAMQAYVAGSYVSIGSLIATFRSMNADQFRVTASGFNTNDIGLIIALGMPMAWYLALFREKVVASWFWRLINVMFIPTALLAIFLTGSRGSLIATVPAGLFMLSTAARMGAKARAAVILSSATALIAIPFLVPDRLIERISTTGESIASGDFGGRGKIWSTGLTVFYERPLVGTGAGTCSEVIGRSAHNVYLSVIVDVGLIGLLLLLTIIGLATYEAIRQPSWNGRLCLALLMTLALGSMVHTWEQRKQSWLILTLVVVSADVSRRRSGRGAAASVPSGGATPQPIPQQPGSPVPQRGTIPYPTPRFQDAWRTT